MANASEIGSDGSDIEGEFDAQYDAAFDRFVGRNADFNRLALDRIERGEDDGLIGFFVSDNESSDDEDDNFGFHVDWESEHFNPRVSESFKDVGGANIQHPEEAQPLHYFNLVWGDEMWDHLLRETNRYAEQERTRNPPPSYAPKWIPVDVPAMKAFIGLTCDTYLLFG